MTSRQHTLSPLLAAGLAALATLSACSPRDEHHAQERIDGTMAKAERQTSQARADANRALGSAQQAANDAGSKVAGAVTDAAITTTITAELARDTSLDATKIDVDTSQGHVVLRGSAPDAEAKDRAKRIALAVSGVRAVDNYLTVGPKS
jgi:hyperosmotically inducible protein